MTADQPSEPRRDRAPAPPESGSAWPSLPRLFGALARGTSGRGRAPRADPVPRQPTPLPVVVPDERRGGAERARPGPAEAAFGARRRRESGDPGGAAPGLAAGALVIGYLTVAEHDPETDEGTDAIDEACRRAGWELLEVVRDRDDGTRTLQRPGLSYALRQIGMGYARALVVANARYLSRSIVDLGALMDVFCDAQAALVALDLGLDTSTPDGRRIADVVSMLGSWERERIVRRTSAGLQAARSDGRQVGRPGIKDQPALGERIVRMRTGGMTLQEIADELNAEGVPTVRGGRLWRPSSVQTALGYRRPRGRRLQPRLPGGQNGRDAP